MKQIHLYYKISIIFLFLGLQFPISAQLSIVSGYTGGYYQLDTYNDIINRRVTTEENIARELNEVNILNGVMVGFNYRFPIVSVEALWTERFRLGREQTFDPATGNRNATNRLTDRFRSVSLGLNFHTDNFLVGAALNRDAFKQNWQLGNNDRRTITQENFWASRFQIGYRVKLNRTFAFSIQPYYYLPFSDLNLSAFDAELNGVNNRSGRDNLSHFGLSIFLYNGPQRY